MAETQTLVETAPGSGLFDRLMRRHQKQAYHVAYRLTGNHADAEDLTQEAFVRAFRFFDSYRRDLPFDKWLFRIMSNLFVDGVRKSGRIKTTSLDAPISTDTPTPASLAREIPDSRTEPERVTLHEEMDELIHHALAAIPADYRKAVILADIEQMSYEEIAKLMGCSVGTVRSRLHRGRKLLRAKLTGFSVR